MKPPKEKTMVRREIHQDQETSRASFGKGEAAWPSMKSLRKLMSLEDEEEFEEREEGKDETFSDATSVRNKRNVRNSAGQSPLAVSYAANYNEKENKGWVKPLFSSIVYRLPVCVSYFIGIRRK